ncbi:UDP-glucose 4-epimerase GalE [Candidatus Gottesmanbacteria bacterium]|nr:UDP-glucose 4-epimerase GalE [Candidatus Gottesmanbacteria bacterium]
MQRTIFVTGAGGYIGSVTAYTLLAKGYRVIAVDNFSTGYREPLEALAGIFGSDRCRFYEADIGSDRDLGAIIRRHSPIHAVVHLAASCSVAQSVRNPALYIANNACATNTLLATMVSHGVGTLVFSSTCAVYGAAKAIPVHETHPTAPLHPYAASKRMAEEIIQWYGKVKNVRYVLLRYFNVCGASDDGRFGDSKKPSTLLVQNCVRAALGIAPFSLTCAAVDTPDGTPVRDYIHVADVSDAHVLAIRYLDGGGQSELFNLGSGRGSSVLEVVSAVNRATGTTFPCRRGKTRPGEYARIVASVAKARTVLGWRPGRSLEASIASLLTWYRGHPKGWGT